MKKKTMIMLFALLGTMSANAQLLFRISGNSLKAPSYMMGTVHSLPGFLLDSIPTYHQAEEACQQFYSEVDTLNLKSIVMTRNKAAHQKMRLPDGKTIADVLNKEQLDLLDKRLKENLYISIKDKLAQDSANVVCKAEPLFYKIFMETILAMTETKKMHANAYEDNPNRRNDTSTIIDVACLDRAKKRNMKIGELDDIEGMNKLLEEAEHKTADISAQVDSLMDFLENYEKYKQNIIKHTQNLKDTEELWRKGDYERFANNDLIKEMEKMPTLIKMRNDRWLPKMLNAMNEAPTMFVFGGGHLIGKDGIIQQLRSRGYKVEQIK